MRKSCLNADRLPEKLKGRVGYLEKSDLNRLKRAWAMALGAHRGQKRKSGESYIHHPLAVAVTLADWKLDADTIIAGLLHDTLEDTFVTKTEIEEKFGLAVVQIVDGVTRVTELRLKGSSKIEFVENLRKMILAMAKDLRVVLVKLADRLHNMQTLWAIPKVSKRLENATETMEVYAPLAERMGIGEVKGQLEDLAFSYLYPEEQKRLKRESKKYFNQANVEIMVMAKEIRKRLAKDKISANIHGRKKHLYSLWRKLNREEVNGDFDKVHDFIALRIIVNEVADCYTVLGMIHALFKPVPKLGVSDYIAQPKPTGYRSIHTRVFGPSGRIVEVQIRTDEMHEEAEFGVAAHWAYSEVKSKLKSEKELEKKGVGMADKKKWVESLVSWQKEMSDSQEFLHAMKFDLLKHRNFVFSPKGDVYNLPVGATCVDFVYAVHSDLGNFIKGVKVNNKIVSLDYRLKSGDVVEIIKSKHAKKPNKDWLNFVVTTQAKREVKRRLND